MDYFYDCEFLEDGHGIELISLGMVAADGREFYGIDSVTAPWGRIAHHEWLMANVVPSLPIDLTVEDEGLVRVGIRDGHPDAGALMTRALIRDGITDLIGNDPFPRLWAYYAAYDHVALCQLWGRMLDLPRNMPMWTHDLMQERERCGNPELPKQAEGQHNALADARWNRDTHRWLHEQPLATRRTPRPPTVDDVARAIHEVYRAADDMTEPEDTARAAALAVTDAMWNRDVFLSMQQRNPVVEP